MSRFEIDNNGVHIPNKPEVGSGMNTDQWANINDQYMIKPIRGGDGRVLILEDDFTSKNDCATCKGKGHLGEVCPECKGNGRYRGKPEHDDDCTTCIIITDSSQRGNVGARINLGGHKPCPTCDGKGTSSIIIPDDSKVRPTMGNVIAVSSVMAEVKVNDKVLFTNYTGTKFEFIGQPLRIATEKDLIGLVKKLKDNVDGLKDAGFADLENTGTPHV